MTDLSPSPTSVAAAAALLHSVGADRRDAGHLSAALERYAREMRYAGRPASIAVLAEVFARIAFGPSEVTAGHDGAEIGRSPIPRHGELMPDDLLTRRETAQRMRCSEATVKRRTAAGDLAAARNGRLVRYRVADVDAFIAGDH